MAKTASKKKAGKKVSKRAKAPAKKKASPTKTPPKKKAWTPPTGPGTFCWHELLTSDPNAAKLFYGALFGWGHKDGSPGAMGVYSEWLRQGASIGGLMALPQPGIPPHWGIYVHVESVDAAAAKIRDLGGHILVPPSDIPNVGRFCVAQDPQGATFSVYTPKAS